MDSIDSGSSPSATAANFGNSWGTDCDTCTASAGTTSPLSKYPPVAVPAGTKLMYCSPASDRFWIDISLSWGILWSESIVTSTLIAESATLIEDTFPTGTPRTITGDVSSRPPELSMMAVNEYSERVGLMCATPTTR